MNVPRFGTHLSKVWKNRESGNQAAFTLVELLVVIGIVAVLLSIAVPLVSRGLERGKMAKCASNLRVLHSANVQYSLEHGQYVAAAEDMFSGRNVKRWHGTRERSNQPFDGANGPLSEYLGPNRIVRTCPAFHPEDDEGFERSCGGYGYNDRGVGSQQYIHGYSAAGCSKGMPPDRIEHAESTVMFADAAFNRKDGRPVDHLIEYSFAEAYYFVSVGSDGKAYTSFRAQPSIHFRHLGKANVVWCDGHVSQEELEVSYDEEFDRFKLGWFGEENNDLFDPY